MQFHKWNNNLSQCNLTAMCYFLVKLIYSPFFEVIEIPLHEEER